MAALRPVVLVTGSDGLIGRAVCADLLRDHTVVGIDNDEAAANAPFETILCDLTKDDDVVRALARVRARHGDAIASLVHLAAYYDFSGAASPLYEELTVQGTRRLLHGLRGFTCEQFLFSSTILVHEPAKPGELLTEESPLDPDWDYPASKVRAEQALRAERGPIHVVSQRIAGVYDEWCRCLPIAQQIRRIHRKELESYLFPGDSDRGQSFVHLADVVAAIRATIERRAELGPYETFLIGEPDVMTYAELQDAIGLELHGKEWPTVRIPKPLAKVGAWFRGKTADDPGEGFIKPWMIDLADRHYAIAIDRARRLLQWEPSHRLRHDLSGILQKLKADPVKWYEENGMVDAAQELARGRGASA